MNQPLVQARLMNTIGDVYRELGVYPEAGRLLERSLATRERLLGREARRSGREPHLARPALISGRASTSEAESTLRARRTC